MKKERAKSALLVALVISSLFLTGQIWYNEKLWPEGYNFFVNLQTPTLRQVLDYFNMPEPAPDAAQLELVLPHRLVVYADKNLNHASMILTPRSDSYEPVCKHVKDILNRALSKDSKSLLKVSEEDWQKALYTRGIYIDYGISYKIETFAAFMDVSKTALDDALSTVRRFIITPGDKLTNDIYVYLCDETSGQFYRLPGGGDKSRLERMLTELSEMTSPKNRFSFFLGADMPSGNVGEAVFDSYLVLSEEGEMLPSIKSYNPIVREGTQEIDSYNLGRLLRTFDLNPNTARRYINADESIVFVQNHATLKISPNGVIEYRAVSGRGLKLSNSTTASAMAYQQAGAAITFAEKVLYSFNVTGDISLFISSFDEGENSLKATFDYRCAGTYVMFTGEFEGENAVSLELEDGYLKSYTQIIRGYEPQEQLHQTLSTYGAVDTLFARLPKEQRQSRVDEMVIAYDDDGTANEKYAKWFIRLEGQSKFIR